MGDRWRCKYCGLAYESPVDALSVDHDCRVRHGRVTLEREDQVMHWWDQQCQCGHPRKDHRYKIGSSREWCQVTGCKCRGWRFDDGV